MLDRMKLEIIMAIIEAWHDVWKTIPEDATKAEVGEYLMEAECRARRKLMGEP